MTKITQQDKEEFTLYLRNCTDAQCYAVYEKELAAKREPYAALALVELSQRKLPVRGKR